MTSRRQLLQFAAAGTSGLIVPAWAAVRTPRSTEGPFYPQARDMPLDTDNDLTRVAGKTGVAGGDLLDFSGRVLDEKDQPLAGAVVEIWQCNHLGRYHDERDGSSAPRDPNFQGFGKTVADAEGRYRFRTIRPVAYPGRTPHIHFKVKMKGYGELTSQIFIDGEPGNARDGVLRSLKEADRARVMMVLKPSPDAAVKFSGVFDMVLA